MFLHKQKLYNQELNLAYSKIGNGQDIIMCIHGLTRNSNDFYYLANSLADKYTVICVDIFGRGNSDWLQDKRKYNYNTYYNSIINLLCFLGIKKVNIIGTSMGGIIAMYIAAYHPHLVRMIVLNDIGPYIDLNALQKLAHYVKKFPKFSDKSAAEDYLKMFLSPLGLQKDEHWKHMIASSIQLTKNGDYLLNYDPAIGEVFDKDIQSMDEGMNLLHVWKMINHPILILRGQKSTILTYATIQKMIANRENIKWIEYPGIGHVPSLMEEDQINDIKKWLNIRL